MTFPKACSFILRRMLRGYLGMAILIVLPIALIAVLGLIAEGAEEMGIPMINMISITIILSFQLWGGYYSLEFIRDDLFAERKWRLRSLPLAVNKYALATFVTSTLFCTFQGFVLVVFTSLAYGVEWGSLILVAIGIFAVALLSQLVFLTMLMAVKKASIGERLSDAYCIGAMVLGGVWYDFGDAGFIGFLSTYASPISLGRTILVSAMTGTNVGQAILSLVILFVAAGLLGILAGFIGRKRLA